MFYVSISETDRAPELDYIQTIHHGIDIQEFDFQPEPDDHLIFFGRIHPDKGAKEAIEIARACNKPLIMAGIIQNEDYYQQYVHPYLDTAESVILAVLVQSSAIRYWVRQRHSFIPSISTNPLGYPSSRRWPVVRQSLLSAGGVWQS